MISPRKTGLFVGDVLCIILGFTLFAALGYNGHSFGSIVHNHAVPFGIIGTLWIITMFVFNFYELRASKPTLAFLRNFGIAAIIMLVVGFVFFYLIPTTRITPKMNLVIFEAISLALVLIWRRAFYNITRNSFRTRFAIICAEEAYHPLIAEITENPHLGLEFQGSFKTIRDFKTADPAVDLVIIHKTANEETKLLEEMLASHIEVISLAEAYETILYRIPVEFIDNEWIVHSITKSAQLWYRAVSRLLAILVATLVLVITSPVSIAIIIAIKIEDRGPILIRQERVGLHGAIFRLYKFRSMIVLGADGQAETGTPIWSSGTNDPRVTRVGSITRRLHIDEIPQLFNVLIGDISLVGPRPERPDFVKKLESEIPYYFMRHTVSPGFTGWAQIKFRYARSIMDSREKFEYDLYYLKNRNLFLDFGILAKTIQIIFTH